MKSKRVLLTVLGWCLITISHAQISYVFENEYDVYANQPDGGLLPLHWNNGILVVGFNYDSSTSNVINITPKGVSVTFLDTLGTLIWKRSYRYPGYAYLIAKSVIAFNKSSFYLCGAAKDTTDEWGGFFSKFDANGDSLFFRFIDGSRLLDIVPFASDTLMMLGSISDTSVYRRTTLFKIDTFGNVCQQFESVLHLKNPQQLTRLGDKFYIGGTRRTNATENFNLQTYIDVYDGELAYQTTFNPNVSFNEEFVGQCVWRDHLHVATRPMLTDQNWPLSQTRIFQLGSNGTALNPTLLGPKDWNLDGFPPQPLNNDRLVLAIADSTVDFYFLDSSLNTTCKATLTSEWPDYKSYRNFTVLPDGKIAGTGYTRTSVSSPEAVNHWNYLSENMQQYIEQCFFVSNKQLPADAAMVVSPNPFAQTFTLRLTSVSEVAVHDLLGRVRVKLQQASGSVSLGNNLESGIYVVSVINCDGIASERVLKISK